jgi:hypothetical protein
MCNKDLTVTQGHIQELQILLQASEFATVGPVAADDTTGTISQ